MLRVTIHESAVELRFRLEGKLAGEWVREAERCWKTARTGTGERTVVVDLQGVDYVDAEGERLLVAMHGHGVKLQAACPMMSALIAEIVDAPEEGVVRGRP